MAANFNLGLADEGSYLWKSCPEVTPSTPCVSQGRRVRNVPVPGRAAEQHAAAESRHAGADRRVRGWVAAGGVGQRETAWRCWSLLLQQEQSWTGLQLKALVGDFSECGSPLAEPSVTLAPAHQREPRSVKSPAVYFFCTC